MTQLLGADGPLRAIAHRGDPINHRENTLPAVAAALDAGADLVEVDVKTTRSGDPVLLHDLTLERLWNVPTAITEVATGELPCDAGAGPPLLAEALGVIGSTSAALLIDLDHPRWAPPAMQVVEDQVGAGVIQRSQVVWCGRPDAVAEVRAADAEARILLSWDESNGPRPDDRVVDRIAPEAFNPHWPMLIDPGTGPALRAWIAGHRLATCCWTVDDPAVMADLIDRGVDAIITNRIHRLQELLGRDD